MQRSVLKPFQALFEMMERALDSVQALLLLLLGFLLSWWIYVPIHELLHVLGCRLGGGKVEQLDISALYGGQLYAQVFDFVRVGGDYAGRLSGFDTGGSDLTYLMTIMIPYFLTPLGFLLMQVGDRKKQVFLLGTGIPVAFAPLISLTGDFFELASLTLFQVWPGPGSSNRALISDDLFRLLGEVDSFQWITSLFIGVSLVLSIFFVFFSLSGSEWIARSMKP